MLCITKMIFRVFFALQRKNEKQENSVLLHSYWIIFFRKRSSLLEISYPLRSRQEFIFHDNTLSAQ